MDTNNLKVLAIVPCPVCFGLQNLTLSFFGCLPASVECHFLNTRWSDGEFARRLEKLGIPHSATWFGMFSRTLDWANLSMTFECLIKLPIAWRDFLRLYWSFRPHVIYLANHHEIILLWPLLLFVRRRVVCHMHDPPPAIPFQKLSFFLWRRAVGRFLFISESARERLNQVGPLTDQDVVIHNGVEVLPLVSPRTRSDRFPKMFGWPDDAVIFGITGQMSPHKGQEDFLVAADIIRKQCPQARFVIGGKQQGLFFESLRRLVEERRMGHLVGFSGWLPCCRDFVESIDVFVLASRHEEGFGLVLAEAGERAVPVVATKSGGALEIAVDGVNGLLVDKQNASAMAGAMLKLAQQSDLRCALGWGGRQRVCQFFDLAVQVRKFERFLRGESDKKCLDDSPSSQRLVSPKDTS